MLRMRFRIGMDGDVALVHVRDHGVGNDLLAGQLLVDHRLLGNEDGHRRALRVVVLASDVQDVGADDLGHIGEDLRESIGVVFLVDVLDVTLALLFGTRIADVIDVEAQRLGEVVETLEPEARKWFDHGGNPLGGSSEGRDYATNEVTTKCPPGPGIAVAALIGLSCMDHSLEFPR